MKTKSTIVGNLVNDAKKSEKNGVFYFTVAVNESKENTRFVMCFVRDISEKRTALLTKGSTVFVYGNSDDKVSTSESGEAKTNYIINVIDLEILFSKSATPKVDAPTTEPKTEPSENKEDLPF
jgi:hypothetical protein